MTTAAPPYGHRAAWRPLAHDHYADGGSFPEIPAVQYPLDMGRSHSASSGAALTLQLDRHGHVKYDAIASHGHAPSRIVQASFKDLVPLRQRADIGDISLDRPAPDLVLAQTNKTRDALYKLVSAQLAAANPKNIPAPASNDPTFIRYTPSNQMGEPNDVNHQQRIIKLVNKHHDPMEPPKFRHKKIPRGPGSPPPPLLRSPPRKLTAAEQQDWIIPPCISNWKNPKGYTIPLDKRLAADGRGLQDVQINDNFAKLSEALFTADRHAREEVRQRAAMQQKLAQKEKATKEDHLRSLAQKARQDRLAASPRSDSDSGDEKGARERQQLRLERRRDAERQMRMSRMGAEQKLKALAREQQRDISEKIALGLARPSNDKEAMFDARLFNQSGGLDSGFKDDESYSTYDKPLFAAQAVAQSIYRPKPQQEDDDEETSLEKVTSGARFEVLGKPQKGFAASDTAQPRDGPVQFEKDINDPFGVDAFLKEAQQGNTRKKQRIE
ncbi:Pre-mRNA-processing protein 45 [Neolecta irregularis DAH-3]|uniref:Pre-mRNA-processing protein 45 n=1 Tax=Neolecta irregularis (strain DAH-3) TaxID=1198029 RepID=A0A1U7LGL8_NEOID|nr:Pre-mRNA-processing protein 45 [Neolecta irregularis DAH-3]|eukprot:OLL21789.1 Pre-mRNA-processing protein 45 [Neolecta irregularis DAH-3]